MAFYPSFYPSLSYFYIIIKFTSTFYLLFLCTLSCISSMKLLYWCEKAAAAKSPTSTLLCTLCKLSLASDGWQRVLSASHYSNVSGSRDRWREKERWEAVAQNERLKRQEALYLKPLPDRYRYNPEWIVRGQFVTGCPTDYFLPRSEAREKEKKQNSLTTSYNGPCCMCPPLLPWPITKSHRVIILNYCCKTSVARRPPKHIHHVARERVSHSRPPWDPSSQDDC